MGASNQAAIERDIDTILSKTIPLLEAMYPEGRIDFKTLDISISDVCAVAQMSGNDYNDEISVLGLTDSAARKLCIFATGSPRLQKKKYKHFNRVWHEARKRSPELASEMSIAA